MQQLIQEISDMKASGVFTRYINYIRFPYFRSLEANARLDFEYPLTILVGRNGSGKTSVLHALFGAPKDQSVSSYWFSTHTDPIKNNTDGTAPCYIYSYSQAGEIAEVLQGWTPKKGRSADYWETKKPLKKYGMDNIKRYPPIEMSCCYINFRTMISAFDKHFYYSRNEKRQSYLRNRSKSLSRAIQESKVIVTHGAPQNDLPLELGADEISIIKSILGKDYTGGVTIAHKFFREWGESTLFQTKELEYTEAFAGSGEMAVTKIIQKVLRAKKGSLILLDEPEISLHPGAQRKLKQFLLEQLKLNKHQIVISTHSPVFVEGLPKGAIKIFSPMSGGKVKIIQGVYPEEAFHELGHLDGSKKNILVEDKLAEKLLKRVVQDMGEHAVAMFDIYSCPGGASVVLDYAAKLVATEKQKDKFIVLDGDQETEHVDPSMITQAQNNAEALGKIIFDQCGANFGFGFQDSHPQKIKLQLAFLEFYNEKVRYLPAKTPEAMLWKNERARRYLELMSFSAEKIENTLTELDALTDHKQKFVYLAKKAGTDGKSVEVAVIQDIFLTGWSNTRDDNYYAVKEIIEDFKNINERVL